MKRITLLFAFIVMATVINAQKKGDSFVCISDGVNVRKGPGTTYPVCELSLAVLDESGGMPHKGETQKQQLFKGYGTQLTHIEYLGKKENDYLYVNCYEEVEGFGGEGWVSSKFLKPQCDVCKGNPVYIQNGKEIVCNHCKGKGYVDLDTQSTIPSNNSERLPASAKEISENMEMPEFPGGLSALVSWLGNNLQYPAVAEMKGIQGRVNCSFIVECDGSISDIQVISGVDPSLDKEAVRVIKQMPQWKPGKKNGEVVRVRNVLPISFKLPETARNANNSVSSNPSSQTNASQYGTVSASTGIYKQEIQDDYDYWHKKNEIAHKRAIEEGQAKVYFDTVEENTEEKVAKEKQSLETKYGKKYVDALYNGKILIGTPEELILKHTNSTLKSEDSYTRKYWIDNLFGQWAWTVWVNKKTKKVSSVTYH